MALVWDFVREIDGGSPGTTTSYQDAAAQLFYIKNSEILTRTGQLEKGHWEDLDWSEAASISDPGYSALSVEHHFNGLVAASAYRSGDVVLLLYDYFDYLTKYIKKGHIQLQPDNGINVATFELGGSARKRMLDSEYSLFVPNNVIEVQLVDKTKEPVDWYKLESFAVVYDEIFDRVFLKARNQISFFLLEQTFDNEVEYSGTLTEVLTEILEDAGVIDFLIDSSSLSVSVKFLPDQSILDGLAEFCSMYNWYIDATHENQIIIGTDAFIQETLPIVIHEFLRGDTAFSRHFEHTVAPVYSRVCVRRTGAAPLKIYGTVPTIEWDIARRKTFYKDVHDGMTQIQMEALRDELIADLQYTGYEETFTAAFTPYMHVGDGVVVTDEDLKETKGIIVDVQHCFGTEVESHTQFTLRAGGTMANNPPTLTSKYVARRSYPDRTQKLYNFISSPDRR